MTTNRVAKKIIYSIEVILITMLVTTTTVVVTSTGAAPSNQLTALASAQLLVAPGAPLYSSEFTSPGQSLSPGVTIVNYTTPGTRTFSPVTEIQFLIDRSGQPAQLACVCTPTVPNRPEPLVVRCPLGSWNG